MAKKSKEVKDDEEILNSEDEMQANEDSQAEETSEEKSELAIAKEETESLKKELEAAKEAHIRTLAEYDNFRKRTQKEKDAIFGESKAMVITELLTVIDNFERAAENSDADFDGYRKGIEMTFGIFKNALDKLGVESFGKQGDNFDPNLHNAVMHCEDETLEENVITDVFSKGYKIGDKVLRPAMVKVAN